MYNQYGITVWEVIGPANILKLDEVHKAILRVMSKRKRRRNTEAVYRERSVLTVRQLFILKAVIRKHTGSL